MDLTISPNLSKPIQLGGIDSFTDFSPSKSALYFVNNLGEILPHLLVMPNSSFCQICQLFEALLFKSSLFSRIILPAGLARFHQIICTNEKNFNRLTNFRNLSISSTKSCQIHLVGDLMFCCLVTCLCWQIDKIK